MRKTEAGERFSTNEVSRASGLTLRRLQWLDERGIVCPFHNGHSRIWTEPELIDCVVIAALRRKGMSLLAITRLLRPLQRELRKWAYDMHSGDDLLICVEGRQAHVLVAADLIHAMVRSKYPWVVVSIKHELGKFLRKAA